MNRKLVTPGALLMFAGAFLLYWGLKEFGIVGNPSVTAGNTSTASVTSPGTPASTGQKVA